MLNVHPRDDGTHCKVPLATLRTELTRIQDDGYNAVDPTSPGLSTPYQGLTM